VSNEHNTVFTRSGTLYAIGVFLGPAKSSTQMASRSLQTFLQGSLDDRPTDRPTDHATRSVTIGGAHSGEAKFYYCLRPQQVFIGAIDSNTPCLPFLRKRSSYGATPNWGKRHPIAAYYSSINPEEIKAWVGLVGWPRLWRTVYPHKWPPVSYRSSAGQRKFPGQRPTFYRRATQPTAM